MLLWIRIYGLNWKQCESYCNPSMNVYGCLKAANHIWDMCCIGGKTFLNTYEQKALNMKNSTLLFLVEALSIVTTFKFFQYTSLHFTSCQKQQSTISGTTPQPFHSNLRRKSPLFSVDTPPRT